jgi:oxalate decarboxylase/phosphoglucose isomerase-like protein (cupin superfamily)
MTQDSVTRNGTDAQPHQQRVKKPWGWEILWADTPEYCGKILHINAGARISLQYHDAKIETQCLVSGRALLVLEGSDGTLSEIPMEPRKGYTIMPFQRHRLIALEDAEIVEVSTPERGTTFRVHDDYGRSDETEDQRRTERL